MSVRQDSTRLGVVKNNVQKQTTKENKKKWGPRNNNFCCDDKNGTRESVRRRHRITRSVCRRSAANGRVVFAGRPNMCVRSARAERRCITTHTHTHTRTVKRARTRNCTNSCACNTQQHTHPHKYTQLTHAHTRSRAYCACVARFTSSPEPRRRNRPGISLSLVLALSNVVRHRRQLENIITPTTTTTATTTTCVLIYYLSIYFFWTPQRSVLFVHVRFDPQTTNTYCNENEAIQKKKTVKLSHVFSNDARNIILPAWPARVVPNDDDGNRQIGVRRRGTPVFQVQAQWSKGVLERCRCRGRHRRQPPGTAGHGVHRTVLGRRTGGGDQAESARRQDQVPQGQAAAGQALA